MARMTKMDTITSIQELYKRGWSQRKIALSLGIHRSAVKRHLPAVDGRESAPLLSEDSPPCSTDENTPKRTTGDRRVLLGSASLCEPWRTEIEKAVKEGLAAQRIYQDLQKYPEFQASYESVKRFVRGLRKKDPRRFERVEVPPGAEAQVDYGTGSWLLDEKGRKRRVHVLRVVLSHSRKGYTEAMLRQDSESFLRGLENAFRAFGGVPQTLVVDNLKAAVTRADWYDPELHPRLRDFAAFYGVAVLPTKPYHPHHKGKVERAVGYVKNNALQGRTFRSLGELNAHLAHWEATVADTRIHGTTRRQVGAVFAEQEAPALQKLPAMLFPSYEEGRRCVHRDGFVEVSKAYYEAPPEYVGRTVWVRWDSRTVRILNHRMEELRIHPRAEPGHFARTPVAGAKPAGMQSAAYALKQAQRIGHWSGLWAEALLMRRGTEALRVLLGLRTMTKKHAPAAIERACETALSHGAFRLRDLRRLLAAPAPAQPSFDFMSEHPLIRDLSAYRDLFTPTPKETP